MSYVIVIVIGIVVIWAAYAASKKKENKEIEEQELKVRISGNEPIKKPVTPQPSKQTSKQNSLDSEYAAKNGLWICMRCETINEHNANKCVACGRSK